MARLIKSEILSDKKFRENIYRKNSDNFGNKFLDVTRSYILKMRQLNLIENQEEIKESRGLNSSKSIYNQLIEMHYNDNTIRELFKAYKINSITQVIDLLTKTEVGWNHKFIGKDNEKCKICGEKSSVHSDLPIPPEMLKLEEQKRQIPFLNYKSKKIHDSQNYKKIQETTQIINNLNIDLSISIIIQSNNENCEICLDNLNENNVFSLACGHKNCKNCVIQYLNEKINSGNVLKITCPTLTCKEEFDEQLIKQLADPLIYNKYKKFMLNIEVNLNKQARWCPRINCGNYAIVSCASNKCQCKCGYAFCFRCGKDYHCCTSCKNFDEDLFKHFLNQNNVYYCPNCNIKIEKDGGCNHMSCTFCKYQFCWKCFENYQSNHFSNLILGCPYLYLGLYFDKGPLFILFLTISFLLFWPVSFLILFTISEIRSRWIWRKTEKITLNIILRILIFPFFLIVGLLIYFFVGFFKQVKSLKNLIVRII